MPRLKQKNYACRMISSDVSDPEAVSGSSTNKRRIDEEKRPTRSFLKG